MPMLKNGHKSCHGQELLITTNTCGFDTILFTLAWTYFGNSNMRSQINNANSKMSQLIKDLLKWETPTDLQQVYASRNTILKDLYSNWCKNSMTKTYNTTFINCKTGIGGLYARICLNVGNNFASGIEEKKCSKCTNVDTKLLPFLTTKGNVKNLERLQGCIDLTSSHKNCSICKNECVIKKYYNNVVALEVESRSKQHQHKKIALDSVCPSLDINNNQYTLFAVMHFVATLEHFLSYTRQNDNSWMYYDNLKKPVKRADASTEVNPFILCYISRNRQHDFERSSFFFETRRQA